MFQLVDVILHQCIWGNVAFYIRYHYCPTKVGIKKVKKGSSEEPPGLVKFELRHLNNN